MSRSDLVCLDASTTLAFALPDDPLHPSAKAFIKALALQNVTFCAPAMFAYECSAVIRLRVYKKALTPAQGQKALATINALPVTVEYDPADNERAYQIATDYDQPRSYDAAYAAHAEARNVELVTIDAPFFEAVNGNKRPATVTPLAFVRLLK